MVIQVGHKRWSVKTPLLSQKENTQTYEQVDSKHLDPHQVKQQHGNHQKHQKNVCLSHP